jgi:hypothetical protein
MRISVAAVVILMVIACPLMAQAPDSTSYDEKADSPSAKGSTVAERLYFGGTIGFSFGNYTRFSVSPLVGYRLARMWSIGGRVMYEYVKDKRYAVDFTSHNYGGSLFARFRPISQLYLHGEYVYMSYKWKSDIGESDREWVPYLLLGGGIVQPISTRASAFVEVLVDVLRDEDSPYDDWEPWISVGVTAGF